MPVNRALLCLVVIAVPQIAFGQKSEATKMWEYEQQLLSADRDFRAAKKITLVPPELGEFTPGRSEKLDIEAIGNGQVGRLWPMNYTYVAGKGIPFKVLSVIDKTNVLLISNDKQRIWVESYPTDDLADGQNVYVLDYVKVVGTKAYRTVDGASSTVWMINLLPKEESEKRLKMDMAKRKAWEESLAKTESGYRNWVQRDRTQTEGKFLELKASTLYLQSRDGKTFKIPYSTLTAGEQALAKKMQREINETRSLPSKNSSIQKSTPGGTPPVVGPAVGKVIASDDFSSYLTGTSNLLGQAAGGTGFKGTWQSMGLKANLDVFVNKSVGSLGTSQNSNAGNAGNSLGFASPVSIKGGQLFIRYKYSNLNTSKIHESSRLDLNYTRIAEGNRVILGSYITDNLQLVLEPNMHNGLGNLVVDSRIGTVSGTGSHVVLGLLDEQFEQIAIWIDPDANDFYNPLTGENSANAVKAWRVPAGGLTNFVSYSLIRNGDDRVSFDDVVFAREFSVVNADNSSIVEKETKSLPSKESSMLKAASDSTSSDVGNTKENGLQADLSAKILDVKIISESNANGKPIRIVKIKWKNTGRKTIRALDGNFFIADNTGTLPPKFQYTIFACSNSEDGVKPGETFVLPEGGFALPEGCTAGTVRVEITKVLEVSSF